MADIDYIIDLGEGRWYKSILNERRYCDEISVRNVEKEYNAKFIYEWWISRDIRRSALVFWVDNPEPGRSHYQCCFPLAGGYPAYTDLRDAPDIETMAVSAKLSDDGQAMISMYTHDFRWSDDKTIAVDGGPYRNGDLYSVSRVLGNIDNPDVWIVPRNGSLVIIDDVAAAMIR